MTINSMMSDVGRQLEHEVEERARRGKWRRMDGEILDISTMGHDELRNTVRRLETTAAGCYMTAALPWLKAELQERGDWS